MATTPVEIKRGFDAVIDTKTVQERDDNIVPALMSTATIDSYGHIILPSAYERDLGRYLSNPVLCWGHPLSAMCETPGPENLLGRSDSTTVRRERDENDRGGLDCVFRYAVAENPRAELCYKLVRGGYLKAYSIGAYGLECVTMEDRDSEAFSSLPAFAQLALLNGRANGGADVVWTRMQLIENSQVLVGACPEALVAEQAVKRAISDGVVPASLALRAFGLEKDTQKIVTVGLDLKGLEDLQTAAAAAAPLKMGRLERAMCQRANEAEANLNARLDALKSQMDTMMMCLEVVGAEVRELRLATESRAESALVGAVLNAETLLSEGFAIAPEALGIIEDAIEPPSEPYDPLTDLL